jgi:hypothetical protein
MATRLAYKVRAIEKRGANGLKGCDLCGQGRLDELEYHEIVNRGQTVNNPHARQLSYDEKLCSLLCKDCHSQAHNPEVRSLLWARQIQLYGYEEVRKAFVSLLNAMNMALKRNFPREEELGYLNWMLKQKKEETDETEVDYE